LSAGYLWARIHLRVPTTAGRLALAVYPRGPEQYEVFVNGSPLASTPGMATRTPRYGSSFPVALARAGDTSWPFASIAANSPFLFFPFFPFHASASAPSPPFRPPPSSITSAPSTTSSSRATSASAYICHSPSPP
jgi:hypothetical protein